MKLPRRQFLRLADFNREYRRRRIEAAARGQRYPFYGHAVAKLRAGLAGTLAGSPRGGGHHAAGV